LAKKEKDVEGSLSQMETKVVLGQEGKMEAQIEDGQALTGGRWIQV